MDENSQASESSAQDEDCCMRPMGLPCHHIILKKLSGPGITPILLEEIDVQWHLDPPDDEDSDLEMPSRAPAILNPTYVRSKGRPRGSLNKLKHQTITHKSTQASNSTKRDPSLFEHVQIAEDKALGRVPKRRCGICKRSGHDRRNHEQYEKGLLGKDLGSKQSKDKSAVSERSASEGKPAEIITEWASSHST